jgi:protease I
MTISISGKRVAFLATDGVEEVEYTEPRKAVEAAGGTAELVSISDGENPDFLRADPDAVRFVRDFMTTGKPVAAICHGPWTLIDAGVVEGRTLTSWPSLRTDLTNAGATWVDEQVHVDNGLVTSRKPDDIPAFCTEMLTQIAKAG